MQYKLTWLDSHMIPGCYKTRKELKQAYAAEGVKLTITSDDGEWAYYDCEKLFEPHDDAEAIAFTKEYDFCGGDLNGTGVFTLDGIDTDLYWTEES
jgi:hypothetical protein